MRFPYDVPVGDWEEAGWTIAEHTSSPPLDWSAIRNVTLHYPGADREILSEDATVPGLKASLRAAQRSYVRVRGYSYGYNAVVWGSLAAEVRGESFRCAANGATRTNTPSFAIQIRAGGVEEEARAASAAEIVKVRQLVAWCEQRAGRRLDILGHRDHKATPCPGQAVYDQIESGVFRPQNVNPPEETMTRYFTTAASPSPLWVTTDGVTAFHVQPEQWAALGSPSPELIGGSEAAKFAYVGTLPHGFVY